jgi:NAD(P)-dependent dehydrogenase (short-subunit alcohol dehydrogenase family)
MSLNPRITDWQGKHVWLIGASTGIGRATAQALHARGALVAVSARNAQALAELASAHPGMVALPLDVTDRAALRAGADQLLARQPLDMVMYCAGYYRDQRASAFDLGEMLRHQEVNYVGALYALDAVLARMLAAAPRGAAGSRGHISLVSSVAGFRGLPKSLGYGPTKAALINLAETLYIDLRDHGLGVSVINPGFVETPLTAQNQFDMPGLISPEQAASEIIAGWERGEFDIHFPKRFTRWMKLLRVLPYPAFFKATRQFTGL